MSVKLKGEGLPNFFKRLKEIIYEFVWIVSDRSDGQTGTSGIARICIEYESEMQESQMKPANLLDALERGDQHRGEANGEDKVGTIMLDGTIPIQYW